MSFSSTNGRLIQQHLEIFDLKNDNLEIRVRGHSKSSKAVPFHILCMVLHSYLHY